MNAVDSNSEVLPLVTHFKNMTDYRVKRTKKYELIEIIMVSICGSIAGADDWVDVAAWGEVNTLEQSLKVGHQ